MINANHDDDRMKYFMYVLAVLLFLFLLSVAAAIFLVFLAHDIPVATFLLINDKNLTLNFTDADVMCRKRFGRYGRLLVLESEEEESRFMDEYLHQTEDFHKRCPKVYIGFRVRVTEKHRSLVDTSQTFALEMKVSEDDVEDPPNDTACLNARVTDDYYTLKRVNCTGGSYTCALCEMIPKYYYQYSDFEDELENCPLTDPICYVVVVESEPKSFEHFIDNCIEGTGRMALVGKDSLTFTQLRRLNVEECIDSDLAMMGVDANIVLETINGVKMKYKTKLLEPGIGIDNCVVTTKEKSYPWRFEKCGAKNCYACSVRRYL